MPTPNLIIHGGAGAITRENLSSAAWAEYSASMLRIHRSTTALLEKGVSALDAATHAVTLFEDCPLFNCGKGAVFTRDGTNELEASVMVTHAYRKRYCALALLSHVKNPIKLAREMLIRGEHDGSGDGNSGGDGDPAGGSGGAQGHCCLSGHRAEKLAKDWGLEMVDSEYFWTRKRWEQHRKGLGKSTDMEPVRSASKPCQRRGSRGDGKRTFCANCADDSRTDCGYDENQPPYAVPKEAPLDTTVTDRNALNLSDRRYPQIPPRSPTAMPAPPTEPTSAVEQEPRIRDSSIQSSTPHSNVSSADEGWDGVEYLPQGTVGCVALDHTGAICVATSTGGLTNKLAGRIGDTPSVGAGFWAEEWAYCPPPPPVPRTIMRPLLDSLVFAFHCVMSKCWHALNSRGRYEYLDRIAAYENEKEPVPQIRAVALSSTGNGDSFLRLAACRTAGAIVRFSPPPPGGLVPIRTLASAVNQITGRGGELQLSAGDRWGKTGEGEAGMIGIEYTTDDGTGKESSEVVFDFNCGGLFRCWVDAQGLERVMVFRDEY